MSKKVATNSPIRILFVCTGNTCRSAMAESIFKSEIKKRGLVGQYSVSSAGLYVKVGDKMNDTAKVALKNCGITPHSHKARVLTKTLLSRASLVVCMTQEHKNTIKNAKVLTVGDITKRGDVPDPYGYGVEVYQKVIEYLNSAVDEIFFTAKEFFKNRK